jgi:GntR family transcriptional regulator
MIRADELLRASPAEPENAKLLGVPASAPVLLVERVSFTYGERPVELRRGFCLTKHHHYHNTLT